MRNKYIHEINFTDKAKSLILLNCHNLGIMDVHTWTEKHLKRNNSSLTSTFK